MTCVFRGCFAILFLVRNEGYSRSMPGDDADRKVVPFAIVPFEIARLHVRAVVLITHLAKSLRNKGLPGTKEYTQLYGQLCEDF